MLAIVVVVVVAVVLVVVAKDVFLMRKSHNL